MNECIKHIKNVLFWSLTLISSLIITHGQANTLNNIWMKGISEELSEDFDILKNEELGMEYVDVSPFYFCQPFVIIFFLEIIQYF